MTEYNPEADRNRHFDFITAIARERLVRSGATLPLNETECRQQQQGPRPSADYDCVLTPPWETK